jgi:hypothetical protein
MHGDQHWRIGDTRWKSIIVEKNNGWVLNSGLPESSSLEDHINALLERVASGSDRIRSLSEVAEVELSCVVYGEHMPALNFAPRVVHRIAQLGASLDIDLYISDDE